MWIDHTHNDIENDQMDFFQYCFRKVTLRSFVEFAELQDKLRAGDAWQSAARGIVRCYLRLADRKDAEERARKAEEAAFEALSDAEKKKALSKKRKAEAKAAAAAAAGAGGGQQKGAQSSKAAAAAARKADEPPPPEELDSCDDALKEASTWAQRLLAAAGDASANTDAAHRIALTAQTRAGRFVLAMRSARAALHACGEQRNVEVERDVALLLDAIDRSAAAAPDAAQDGPVQRVLASARSALPGGGDVDARLAALDDVARAEVAYALAASRGADLGAAAAALTALVPKASLGACQRWLLALERSGAPSAALDALRAAAHARHPRATVFKPTEAASNDKK